MTLDPGRFFWPVLGAVAILASLLPGAADRANAVPPATTAVGNAPTAADLIRTAPVVRPGAVVTYDPFPFAPLFGYRSANVGFPQPLGHEIIPTGPNGYVYRPVRNFDSSLTQAIAALHRADYPAVLTAVDPVLAVAADNGMAWLLRSHALFALARYPDAAQALQVALRLLPQDDWGLPIEKKQDFYRSATEYTARLTALERYVQGRQTFAPGHFLLGYHYGFLGQRDAATREFQTVLALVRQADVAEGSAAPIAAAPLGPIAQPPAAVAGGVVPDDERPRPGLPLDDEPVVPLRPRGRRDF